MPFTGADPHGTMELAVAVAVVVVMALVMVIVIAPAAFLRLIIGWCSPSGAAVPAANKRRGYREIHGEISAPAGW